MRKILLPLILCPILLFSQTQYTDYVNPFIGTGGHGHTFPGATLPFGMVQLSPDTRLEGWDGCSGYHYDDNRIYGFSHTHLSGTGVADYCDILVKPMSRPVSFDREKYASSFIHGKESARPGYYSVFLEEDKLLVELSATTRVGFHRYTFTPGTPQHVILDLTHRDQVLEASLEIVNDRRVRGMRRSSSWARDQVIYFVMEFDRPITSWTIRNEGREDLRKTGKVEAKDLAASFTFESRNQPLLVKVGLSLVSMEGAGDNLAAECPGWDFDKIKESADATWQEELSKIKVKGNNPDNLTNFYTALYHCMIHPNVVSDVDGSYRGMDKKVHKAIGYDHYSVFSLWDTYRSLHPLLTIIDTRRTNDFIRSMLAMYEQSGRLPVWELAANETNCMIGYHAVSVIADAYLKKIRNWDSDFALEAMVATANSEVFGIPKYIKKGYLEIEDESESVSKTLEYAYNDWCIAEMARLMRKQSIYEEFLQRSIGYRHLFDTETGFIRPRSNGGWLKPFDPKEVTNHYTEANGWQYTFYAPHDLKHLITGMGGEAAFEQKLDQLFETNAVTGREQADITGLVGQYAQGNEPSHHMAYLYAYSGSAWKSQLYIDQIMDLYKPTPDGLPGNEDCGQMSAWYVFSAMGFYPVTPVAGSYIFGTPLFEQVLIPMPENQVFEIRSNRRTKEDKFIQSIYINRELWPSPWMPFHFVKGNVDIDFRMDDAPEKTLGQIPNMRPKSEVKWPGFARIPAIEGPNAPFRDETLVTLKAEPGKKIYFSLDGDKPDKPFMDPIRLTASTQIAAISIDEEGNRSPVVLGSFYKVPHDWLINVRSKVHPQYTAGGPDALIDGLAGDTDWRKGRWQGYQGQDLEVIIDLGKKRKLTNLGARFLQDTRAWIVLPNEVVVSVSNDGTSYKEAITLTHDHQAQTEEAFMVELQGKSKVKKGRYIKLRAKNYGKLPTWHPGAGGESYIFIDEVLIGLK
ncbi:MAG: GH92 family glycosyl hydrolase [Saprospiraceae bacterium]|nr:GH92 family glycosyl hydrolase [Saprospiraceae bacterium]